MQALDDALERALLDLVVADRLVVVVLDVVDQLGAQRAVVADQRVAREAGQRLGVPAQPDAPHQQQEADDDGGEDRRELSP